MVISIYGLKSCRPCQTACDYLKVRSIPFVFNQIKTDEDREDVKHMAGIKGNLTIPQFFIGEKYIGNYQEFKQWLRENQQAMFK